jgi:multiple sugar transport system permease protein
MFNTIDIVWLLTRGGPLTATEQLPILAYIKTFDMFDIGGGTAVATSIFVFLTLLIWLYFRLFPPEETD